MTKIVVADDSDGGVLINKSIKKDKTRLSGVTVGFAQKSIIYIVGNLLEKASQLLLIPLYTRLLTTGEYGFYGAAVALCGVVVPLVDLGISSSLERFIHDYYDKPDRLLGYLKLSFWLRVVSSLIAGFICGLLLFVSWNWLFSDKHVDRIIVLWIIIFGVGNTLTDFVCAYFRNTSQAVWFVVGRVSQTIIQAILVIYFLFFVGKTAVAILSAQALGALISGTAIMCIFYVRTFLKVENIKIDNNDWKYNLTFGIPLIPHQIGNWLRTASDRVLLGKFVSMADVGLYQLSVSVGNILSIFVSCVDLTYIPTYYRVRITSGQKAFDVLRSFNSCYIIGMGLLTTAVSLFSGELISILAPHRYAYAAQMTPLVLYAIYFQGQYTLVVKPLFFHKRTKLIPLLTLSPGILGVLANILLLPICGLMTVVWVNLAVYFATFVIVYIVGKRVEVTNYPLGLGIICNIIIATIVLYLTYNTLAPWGLSSISIRILLLLLLLGLGWGFILKKEVKYLKANLNV